MPFSHFVTSFFPSFMFDFFYVVLCHSVLMQKEMVKRRYDLYKGLSSSDATAIATEYTPLFKWLGFGAPAGGDSCKENEKEEENIDVMNLDDQESLVSDDEIEDW